MVIKISSIQDYKLKHIANKVDSKQIKNGNIDKEELDELFIQMINNSYDYETFNSLLGRNFESLAIEDKLQVYEDCYAKLNKTVSKNKKRVRALEKRYNKKNEIAITGLSSILGSISTFNNSGTLGLLGKSILKGGIIGAIIGATIGIGVKLYNKNSLEKAYNDNSDKEKFLEQIRENIDTLKNT